MTVQVQFEFEPDDYEEISTADDFVTPPAILEKIKSRSRIWVTRDLQSATYAVDPEWNDLWNSVSEEMKKDSGKEQSENNSEDESRKDISTAHEFAGILRAYWPSFVYFDSFEDTLPRSVAVESLFSPSSDAQQDEGTGDVKKIASSIPAAVRDFIALSGLDINRVRSLAENEKALSNYLQNCGTQISGDFLSYWHQRVDGEQVVNLHVRGTRDSTGQLKLSFYVHDLVDQYPEQRSKGFLWFLSFYLRLAAWDKLEPNRSRLVLIDEPGTYLHAKAQKDVLALLESRVSARQLFVYSTHSVHLLPFEKMHRFRVVIKSSQKGTLALDRVTHPELRGADYSDTLLPIMLAVGLDVPLDQGFMSRGNLIVEGMSDRLYIQAWLHALKPELVSEVHVMPGHGAPSIYPTVSMLIGWGFDFAVVLDRDDEGSKAKDRLLKDYLVHESKIVQPNAAKTIEDLFEVEDFKKLVLALDSTYDVSIGDRPSTIIKRQRIDKVLLARTFSERISNKSFALGSATKKNVLRFLDEIKAAFDAS